MMIENNRSIDVRFSSFQANVFRRFQRKIVLAEMCPILLINSRQYRFGFVYWIAD